MLEELLGSKSRARLVSALLRAPDRRLHLRQLVREAGGSISSVQREVARFENMGLAVSERDSAGRRWVQLVEDHPFAQPLAGLVAAEPRAQYATRVAGIRGIAPSVNAVMGGYVDALVAGFDPIRIVLFGSQARGEADAGSDIDLLVVLRKVGNKAETARAMLGALGKRAVGVDVIPTDSDEISAESTKMASVVREALEEGRVLYERPG